MKKLLFLGLFLTVISVSYAQTDNPVHWSFSSKKVSAQVYELHIKALIDPPYHVYSKADQSGIALPIKVSFNANPNIALQGVITEHGELTTRVDQTSGLTLKFYADEVDFVQVVKLKRKGKIQIKGHIDYMACTDDHCLPEAKQLFTINLGQ